MQLGRRCVPGVPFLEDVRRGFVLCALLRKFSKSFASRFPAENAWEQLRGSGDAPSCLQEHTMVGYMDCLYVFGGEVGFSSIETPLWIYEIKVRIRYFWSTRYV